MDKARLTGGPACNSDLQIIRFADSQYKYLEGHIECFNIRGKTRKLGRYGITQSHDSYSREYLSRHY